MEVIGDTNCESIKNQSEVMKEINHVRENKLNETARKYTKWTKVVKIVNECVTVATIAMSAILIVVGLLAAVPSGGSSIAGALALIGGIAGAVVLGVDITCQIALGTTATGWILGKVVEGLSAAIKTVDPLCSQSPRFWTLLVSIKIRLNWLKVFTQVQPLLLSWRQ